jgi:hypothetical protein
MKRVYLKCFFFLNLLEIIDLNLKKKISLRFIIGFGAKFLVIKSYEYVLQSI